MGTAARAWAALCLLATLPIAPAGAQAGPANAVPATAEAASTPAPNTPAGAAPDNPAGAGNGGAPELPPDYLSEIKKGLLALDDGATEEARTHFLTAHRRFPNARSLRALGMVEFQLRRYQAAIDYLQAALDSGVRPLTATMRAEVAQLLAQANAYVAPYSVVTRPAGAGIWVDGSRVDRPADGRVLLTVGKHEIEARAEGYVAARRQLDVQDNQPRTLNLQLLPLTGPGPSADADTDTDTDTDTPVYARWWLWTGVGAVVAAGVVTAIVVATSGSTVAPSGTSSTGLTVSIPEP